MTKYLLLIFAILLFSCSSDDVNGAYYTYQFFEDSSLTISVSPNSYMKYGTIDEGDKIVFKYYYKAKDEEQIADDEYSESIFFEIDSGLNDFLIEGDALNAANTILKKSCFCFFQDSPEKNVDPIGFITGEKISSTKWKVLFNVTFYGDDKRNFEAVFELDEI